MILSLLRRPSLLFLGLFALACSDPTSNDQKNRSTGECTSGQVEDCTCSSGEPGGQVCLGDGSGFSECLCGGIGEGGADSWGTGGFGMEEAGPGGMATGGMATGGTATGGTATGGTGLGGDLASICDSIVVSTGTPPTIDDFSHRKHWNLPDDSDGRVGTWVHEYWDVTDPNGPSLQAEPDCGNSSFCIAPVAGHLVIACNGSENERWCNTPWDPSNPWVQWARVFTRLTRNSDSGTICYNAATAGFTGLRFDAMSD